ncbi:MAG: VWA domain-containing protein [Cyanobacteria bacterium J06621_8]
MKLEQLPLREIFNRLRQRHDFPLGVEEYLVVVQSLQAGFGLASRTELEQLCCTLWAKSPQESKLINRLFQQMWGQLEDKPKTSLPDDSQGENKQDFPQESELEDRSASTSSDEFPDNTDTELAESPTVTLEEEPVQVVKAVRNKTQDSSLIRPRYSLLDDYFPVTKRQMKQSWRYLRRLVREGVPIELDVEATVAKTIRQGILLEPVLIPPRVNRTDLLLLIDREGSMVPFHTLSRQLSETATRGGRLRQTRVFYFHDYVDEYVYRHPALINAQHLDEMLAEAGERAAILIISDGGAARSSFDQIRVERTRTWIEQLQKSAKYLAWLNPMPSDSWQHTTAGEIAQMLPMFSMNRTGMNAAISVLRGRHIAGEVSNG